VYGSPEAGTDTGFTALLGEVLQLVGSHANSPVDTPLRQSLTLHAAVPNPFNPQTTLAFGLGRDGFGSVRVYNLRGELVRSLAEAARFSSGENIVRWDGRDGAGDPVASGIYIVFYDVDGERRTQKVALLK
jgi:hypothetical protein